MIKRKENELSGIMILVDLEYMNKCFTRTHGNRKISSNTLT